jgi:hypothetical protein
MRIEGRMDGRMDGHAEANRRFSLLNERVQKIKKKNIRHFSFSGLIPDISHSVHHPPPQKKQKQRKKQGAGEIQKLRKKHFGSSVLKSVGRKDLPKARVKLGSLGNQVFPQWRSILKQKNNNQAASPSDNTKKHKEAEH